VGGGTVLSTNGVGGNFAPSGGMVLHTIDGGTTWAAQTLQPATAGLGSVTFFDASNGWVGGYSGAILHTIDGGITWTAQTSGTVGSIYSIAFTTASVGWAVSDGGVVLHTIDGGTTWTSQTLGLGDNFYSVKFADASNGWIVGGGGEILHTTDAGVTWTPQVSNDSGEYLYSASFTSITTGWAVGANGMIVNTTDAGVTWAQQPSNTPEFLGSGSFPSIADGWAVGENGAIVHYMIDTFKIAVAPSTNGTITPPGDQTVDYGSNQTFAIVPDAGYHVADVLVDSLSVGPVTSYTFTNVTGNRTISATFAINTYTLTYTAGAGGTITGTSPQTVNSGGSGTLVTAVPNAGYHFVSWSDTVATAARTDAGVTGNITVTASFAIDTFTLTYTAGAGGTITGTSPQTVNSGGSGTLVTAVPNAGYHFVSWSDTVATAARTDAGVTGNITVTASFAISQNLMPVWRFRNLKNGFYLWSADPNEKATIVNTLSATWLLEGVAYNINTSNPLNSSPLWRFRNIRGGFYLYTADPGEKATIINTLGGTWTYEGPAYNVSMSSSGAPVWRFRNLHDGTYLYSADPNEVATIVATLKSTWLLEGVAYYLAP
jgi:photosystem II stability/assembly factor-like uncharacterized protein